MRREVRCSRRGASETKVDSFWDGKRIELTPRGCTSLIAAHGRQRAWDIALAIIYDIWRWSLQPNPILHTAALGATQRGSQWLRACCLLKVMREISLRRTTITCGTAVGVSGTDQPWQRSLEILYTWMCRPDVVTCSAAMTACGSALQWTKASLILRGMLKRRVREDAVACSGVLCLCQEGTHWWRSVCVYDQMRQRTVKPDASIVDAIVSNSGRAGQWTRATAMLLQAQKEGIKRGGVTHNVAISVHETSNRWTSAVEFLQGIRSDGILPTAIAFNAAASAAEKGDAWEGSVRLFGEVQKITVELASSTYNVAASGWSAGQHWERAVWLLRKAQSPSVALEPDRITQGAAITAVAKGLHWESAAGALSQMLAESLELDAIMFNAALDACDKASLWHPAVLLLDFGVERDVITCNVAINVCQKTWKWDSALNLVSEMRSIGIRPTVATYNSGISPAQDELVWAFALHFLRTASNPMAGIEADVVTYGATIGASSNAGMWIEALETFRSMSGRGFIPVLIACKLVIAACLKQQHWAMAWILLDLMALHRIQPDATGYSVLLMECEQQGALDRQVALLHGLCGDRDVASQRWLPLRRVLTKISDAASSARSLRRL